MRAALLALVFLGLIETYGQAGTVDPTFTPQMGNPQDSVYDAVALPDGRIIIAGNFTVVQGVPRKRIARLFSNGTLDTSFDPGDGPNEIVRKILVQPDGRIVLYGSFTSYDATPRAQLARIMPDGALDPTFSVGTGIGVNGHVYDWVLMSDGRLVIVGDFASVNGAGPGRVARLLSTGAADPTWNFGSGTVGGPQGNTVGAVAIQPDGKILIGGYFISVQGAPCRSLARLFSTGTVESSATFNQTIGFTISNGSLLGQILSIQVQPDGKILVGGIFDEYSGIVTGPLVRMSSNGLRETAFAPVEAYNTAEYVYAMKLLQDGRLITKSAQGVIRRLKSNGSIDPTFTSYGSLGFVLLNFNFQPDGAILLADPFVRLKGDATGAIPVALRLALGGTFDAGSGLMNDALRVAGLIPQAQPYTLGAGYTQVAGGGNERVPSWSLTDTGPNAIVDWVMVELRDQPNHVAMTRCGLLQRDGDVVGMDGTSPLYFLAAPGDYRVAVRHRNHLGVMTAAAVTLSTTPATIDFTLPGTSTYGTAAQNQVGNKMVLWAGHTNFDNVVKYTGANNDRDAVVIAVGSATPNNTVSNVYDRADTNLDGVIKYTGANNDRDVILLNVGSTTPNNTRTQQLP